MRTRAVVSGATDELKAVEDAYRAVLRAEARRDSATQELKAARAGLKDARGNLWEKATGAREAGATLAEIAARLNVSVARAGRLLAKATERGPERG